MSQSHPSLRQTSPSPAVSTRKCNHNCHFIAKLILDAPMIVTHPQDTSVLTGESVTISCNITALPRPMVTWLKDNETIEYDRRLQLLEDGSLYISNVMLADVGLYQCMATNINGSVESDYGMVEVSGKMIDCVRCINKMDLISEATCFDDTVSPHETDVDCGGEFCSPCNISQVMHQTILYLKPLIEHTLTIKFS